MAIGNFQKKALGVALLILTFSIAIMSYANYKKKSVQFPPLINECPDYFTYNESGDLPYPTCSVSGTIYGKTIPSLPLNGDYVLTNSNSMCKKKTWARGQGVTWDGITNDASLIPC